MTEINALESCRMWLRWGRAIMDERYRIGEVVKGMGVGQYTLKHYEREGLVVPVPREESGYRYYSYRDFGRLIFVRNLRALGFSLDAVAEYLDAAFEDKPDLLAQQMVANTGEIERLMTANEALRRREEALRASLDNAEAWRTVSAPDLVFIPHFHGEQLDESLRSISDEGAWREVYEHASIAVKVSRDRILDGADHEFEWGLLPDESRTPSEGGHAVWGAECTRCLLGELVLERDNTFDDCLVDAVRRALADNGVALAGDALAVQRAVQRKGQGLTLLLSVYVPLRE